ncbi:alkaline phosphatase D family protein [Salinibacter grassmerensis]|uniref:alkaline phosphatase D family protein n=1 Tax=Salinibacter grassmerensis TaxID=3040353 RepID=UPI0021E8CEF2|nr:alkaline phosphatase D family protein [Salinibacter grassmerensis]
MYEPPMSWTHFAGALLLLGWGLVGLGCTGPEEPSSTAGGDAATPITRIAFGSCNDQTASQPLWDPIRAADPDLWVWMGDNVYADTLNMTALDSIYARQNRRPGYRALRESTRVIGTWDDHDYGANDAGRSYPKRDRSQEHFLDFIGVPEDHPRRERAGVYSAHTYGPPGRRVKVILLDTRYHRDPITRDPISGQRYFPNEEGDILGETQWTWLKDELRSSTAQVHLIGTSIQAVSSQHPWEKWANFPQARARLFRVINDADVPGAVLLSGDRHISEISRHDEAAEYPLYEFTSSGLTHHAPMHEEANRHRVGSLVAALNYGLVTIDWAADPVTLRFEVRGTDNETLLDHTLSLSDLQPSSG